MKLRKERRLIAILSTVALCVMLGGCFPGDFPIPPDRSAPPKPSKQGVSGSSGYHHGAFAPLVRTDATN